MSLNVSKFFFTLKPDILLILNPLLIKQGHRVNTYIALFRGINVGGKNSLPMKELAAIIESLGYKDVTTYIQSGNVVFRSRGKIGAKDVTELRLAIRKKKEFDPKVLILDAEQLHTAVKNNPFPTENGKVLHFFFLESAPRNPNLEKLDQLKKESEKFRLSKEIFYLHAPEGIGRSKLAAGVEKELGVPVTSRNWNTVHKLVSMAGRE